VIGAVPADQPATRPDAGSTVALNGLPLLQVPPAGEELRVADVPAHIEVSPDGVAGRGLTVTVVVLMPVKPLPSVMVTVYIVVTAGAATTAVPIVELRPVAGAHE
jgi:hypothetical protein